MAGLAAHVALAATIAVLGYFIYVYNFLLHNDRDRIHSEAHIQNMRTIDGKLMGDDQRSITTVGNMPLGNPNLLEH